MSVTTIESHAAPPCSAAPENVDSLRSLQRELLCLASSTEAKAELLQGFAELLDSVTAPLSMVYVLRDEQGELAEAIQLRPAETDNHSERLTKQLFVACQNACRTGEAVVRHQATPARTILAAPIALRGRDPRGTRSNRF